jgi:signal-transduction protein with cAMP-binding, CBS, and nucleotidyltransferase domain
MEVLLISTKNIIMLRLITSLLLICIATDIFAQNTEKEKAVRAYYSGFEKKDWNAVAAQFADGFTFTSPNNDDHINVEKFKEKCWATAKFFKKVSYIKMVEKGDDLMLLVQITTTDDNIVRNVDVFNFNNKGKIRSIEVFFGAGSKYPGNKK